MGKARFCAARDRGARQHPLDDVPQEKSSSPRSEVEGGTDERANDVRSRVSLTPSELVSTVSLSSPYEPRLSTAVHSASLETSGSGYPGLSSFSSSSLVPSIANCSAQTNDISPWLIRSFHIFNCQEYRVRGRA